MEPLPVDYEKKIQILEEELVRKQAQIEITDSTIFWTAV